MLVSLNSTQVGIEERVLIKVKLRVGSGRGVIARHIAVVRHAEVALGCALKD